MNCLIISSSSQSKDELFSPLRKEFPQLQMMEIEGDFEHSYQVIQEFKPFLVFFDLEIIRQNSYPRGYSRIGKADFQNFIPVFFISSNQKDVDPKILVFPFCTFLTKPIQLDSLRFVVQEALEMSARKEKSPYLEPTSRPPTQQFGPKMIGIPLAKGVIEIIPYEEIRYLESQTEVTLIHLNSGNHLRAMRNIGFFQELLIPHLPFFRISQKVIIYLPFLRRFDPLERVVTLNNGQTFKVSKRLVHGLKKFLLSPFIQ